MASKHSVIFFADLADSVNFYERIGDIAAKNHVLQLQHLLRTRVDAFGGHVHEIIGDELMVCFAEPDKALACSIALHRSAEHYSRAHSQTLKLRIGMHYGEVIEDKIENRLFGDTVNLAARVTGIAQADQTITTDALVQGSSATWRESVRKFDVATVKGKSEPVIIYDLPWQLDDLTAIMPVNDVASPPNNSPQLVLCHRDKTFDLGNHDGAFTIGRAITNTLVIDTDPVSRRHLTIERERGQYVLTDKSTNGTHLFTNNGETLFLRRQQWPMSGSGELALGASRENGEHHIVEFHCRESVGTG